MYFNGFDEKLVVTENNIAKKLFSKIESQKMFPDEEIELYQAIMEVYDVLHKTPNIEKPAKKISEITSRKKVRSALENEIIYNTFWMLILTHDENGKVVPHEMVLLDLKDKFGECGLIDLLEKKQEEIFPHDGEIESYFFQYETEFWSLKVKLKAHLRKREIKIILKNLFQRNINNIELFLKSNNIIYKDLELVRKNADKENIKLSEYDYILKNYDTIINSDNYYLYLNTSLKTHKDYFKSFNHVLRVKKKEKLEYITVTQNYTEFYDDSYSAKAFFYKNWNETKLTDGGATKKMTGPRALFLLQHIEEFKDFKEIKEPETYYCY